MWTIMHSSQVCIFCVSATIIATNYWDHTLKITILDQTLFDPEFGIVLHKDAFGFQV